MARHNSRRPRQAARSARAGMQPNFFGARRVPDPIEVVDIDLNDHDYDPQEEEEREQEEEEVTVVLPCCFAVDNSEYEFRTRRAVASASSNVLLGVMGKYAFCTSLPNSLDASDFNEVYNYLTSSLVNTSLLFLSLSSYGAYCRNLSNWNGPEFARPLLPNVRVNFKTIIDNNLYRNSFSNEELEQLLRLFRNHRRRGGVVQGVRSVQSANPNVDHAITLGKRKLRQAINDTILEEALKIVPVVRKIYARDLRSHLANEEDE